MPVTTTIGEQVLEAVIAGPDEANRLFTITGAANILISVTGGQQKTETWTFLVGPTFTRGQFYRAIGTASVFKGRSGTSSSRSTPSRPTGTMSREESKRVLKSLSVRIE